MIRTYTNDQMHPTVRHGFRVALLRGIPAGCALAAIEGENGWAVSTVQIEAFVRSLGEKGVPAVDVQKVADDLSAPIPLDAVRILLAPRGGDLEAGFVRAKARGDA